MFADVVEQADAAVADRERAGRPSSRAGPRRSPAAPAARSAPGLHRRRGQPVADETCRSAPCVPSSRSRAREPSLEPPAEVGAQQESGVLGGRRRARGARTRRDGRVRASRSSARRRRRGRRRGRRAVRGGTRSCTAVEPAAEHAAGVRGASGASSRSASSRGATAFRAGGTDGRSRKTPAATRRAVPSAASSSCSVEQEDVTGRRRPRGPMRSSQAANSGAGRRPNSCAHAGGVVVARGLVVEHHVVGARARP